jgi:hypothetical protein
MKSTSSLLKSAAGIRNQIATYQDSLKAYEYSNSAYTDTALADYQSYLKDRITALNATNSISGASKALSLTKALDSATKSNISATIQRENIQVMSGNATLQDKYQVISDQFVRAQANGDMTLAQSLMSQAYSLSQTIQLQAQQSQQASVTLAKAASSTGAKNEADVATKIQDAVKQFNTDYVHAGAKSADKVTQAFVDSMKPTFDALGIVLKDGQKPNYFDIIDGANRAAFKALTNAGQVAAPYAADGGQSYFDKASGLLQNIPTIYGKMDVNQLQTASANQNNFLNIGDPEFQKAQQGPGGSQHPQTGYHYDPQLGVQPTISQTPWVDIPNNLNNRLQALGLQTSASKIGNGVEVTAGPNSPQWLKQVLGSNTSTHILTDGKDAQGNSTLAFEADAQHGDGKAIYTIAKDNTVYESSNLGDRVLFDPKAQNGTNTNTGSHGLWNTLGGAFKTALGDTASMLGGFGGGNASSTLNQATSHYQLPPLPIAPPTPQPALQVAPPAPLPSIQVTPPSYPVTHSVQVPTYSPQPAAQVPLQGSGAAPQNAGGGGLNTSGGGWSFQF